MRTVYIWCDTDSVWWIRLVSGYMESGPSALWHRVSGYMESGPSALWHIEWTVFRDYRTSGQFTLVRGALRRGECAVLIGPPPPSLE